MNKGRKIRAFVASAVFVAALGLGSVVLANANTVPASAAGQGSTAISGYTVGAVAYNLNGTDPTVLDSVEFTLTPVGGGPAATTAKVNVDGSTWIDCTVSAGTWTCSTGGIPVSTATNLNVVAKA